MNARPTVRYSALQEPRTANEARLIMLWHLQFGRCGLCNRDMPQLGDVLRDPGHKPTIEHVFPRNPNLGLVKAWLERGWPVFRGTHGNTVAAHLRCNHTKGNRMPTGCELIMLLAVNLKTREQPKPW